MDGNGNLSRCSRTGRWREYENRQGEFKLVPIVKILRDNNPKFSGGKLVVLFTFSPRWKVENFGFLSAMKADNTHIKAGGSEYSNGIDLFVPLPGRVRCVRLNE